MLMKITDENGIDSLLHTTSTVHSAITCQVNLLLDLPYLPSCVTNTTKNTEQKAKLSSERKKKENDIYKDLQIRMDRKNTSHLPLNCLVSLQHCNHSAKSYHM